MEESKINSVLQLDKNNLVLADFWASWCSPCKKMKPIIEEIRQEFEDSLHFVAIDVEQYMDIAKHFNVMSIPTLIMFEKGVPKERLLGIKSKAEITDFIKKYTDKEKSD